MLKSKIEALLFSSGKKMPVEELAKLTRSDINNVREALQQLKWDYEQKNSSLMVVDEGSNWKITVKEEHLPLVKNIVTETELSKTLMETLAVIAFKYPIKQSDLIKIRTNKAYDHLSELEEMGYITRQKYGRTKLIRLTDNFFNYFSLPEDKLKEEFKDFHGLAKAIETKEEEIKKIREEQKKAAEEMKKEKERMEKAGLEVFDETPEETEQEESKEVEVAKDKLGGLEIVEEAPEEETEEGEEETPEEEQPEEMPKQKEIFNGSELGEGQESDEPEEKPEEAEEEPEVKRREEEILSKEEASPEVDKEFERIMHPSEEEEKPEEEKEMSETQSVSEHAQKSKISDKPKKEKQKHEEEAEEEPEDLLEASSKEEKE